MSVVRRWWIIGISGIATVIGILLNIFASVEIPVWGWGMTLIVVPLVIAQFWAFHEVRSERDDLKATRPDFGSP